MTQARALFDLGEMNAAIEQLTSEVKANPTDATRRTFLFELLCFAGYWDRAEKQLDVIKHQSPQAETGVHIYRNNIAAERARHRLFAEGLHPHFFCEPPIYIDLHLVAINLLRNGNAAEARAMLDRAEEARPALSGKLGGKPADEPDEARGEQEFQDFRDYDDLLGPVLELIVEDKYTWLPFEQIKRMEISRPKQLRDYLWATARVESTDGTIGEVFLPSLYTNSSEHPSDQVKLGRMTDSQRVGEELYTTAGLRMFLVDDKDKPIFEVETVEFGFSAASEI